MQECKVLFLEDSLGDARLVHQMLADAANSLFRVHTADCLVAALSALAQRKLMWRWSISAWRTRMGWRRY